MSQKPSNGTMGLMWERHWCYRCVNDHGASHVPAEKAEYEKGCIHFALLLGGEEDPTIFLSHEVHWSEPWSPEHFECRMFERCPCRDNPGWEPPTVPTPDPNQGLLFEVIDETPFTPMVVIPTSVEEPVDA